MLISEKPDGMGSESTARHHRSDSGAFTIAGWPMEQVTTAERQLVTTEPSLAFEKGFKVVFEHGSSLVIENEIVPLATRHRATRAVDYEKSRLIVAAVEVFEELYNLRALVPPGDDEPRCSFKVTARTGVIVAIERDRGEL